MTKKKTSKLPKNDFAPEEKFDICGFTSEPIAVGDCISSFSFDDDLNEVISKSNNENISNVPVSETVEAIDFTISPINNETIIDSHSKNILTDSRKIPIANSIAPPIDGEFLDVKRTYMLRASTVRKINELKSIHPELNTYVSTIVDMAIAHYYNHIINEGGNQ